MDLPKEAEKYIMNTYRRYPLSISRGKGSYLFDNRGNKYLDFIAGIAVCSFGHSPSFISKVLKAQSEKLIHTSNLFYTEPQIELARRLIEKIKHHDKSLNYRCFFCNSGTEANEAAIKLVRKYERKNGRDRFEIITFFNSFHGRTYGSLSATAQEKFHRDFEPMLPGFRYVRFNDIKEFKKAVNQKTAAVMLEIIQAEGGVNFIDKNFLQELSVICKKEGILLIFDEVQTGVGRTGMFFSFEHFGIEPDILTLAKGVAGGVPMGVMMAKNEVSEAFEPGNHASTFGGSPLVSAVAIEVVKRINKKFLKNVESKGDYLLKSLASLGKKYPLKKPRGLGLLLGIDVEHKVPANIVKVALEKGLLINLTAEKTIRLVPPLNVSYEEIDEFLERFEDTLKEVFR